MIELLFVMLGGAIGSGLRYGVTLLTTALPHPQLSWMGTLAVNVVGSFLIGYLTVRGVAVLPTSTLYRPFFIVGLCGGFTTFSTFSMDLYGLYSRGEVVLMVAYLLLSLVLSVLALLAGLWLASRAR